jgi:hypothetical protein
MAAGALAGRVVAALAVLWRELPTAEGRGWRASGVEGFSLRLPFAGLKIPFCRFVRCRVGRLSTSRSSARDIWRISWSPIARPRACQAPVVGEERFEARERRAAWNLFQLSENRGKYMDRAYYNV